MVDDKLLKKYIAGNATQEEKEKVQLWLDDEKNMEELMALRTLYDITLAHLDRMDEKQSRIPETTHKTKKYIYSFLKVAAAVVITFGLSYVLFKNTGVLNVEEEIIMQSLVVPAGQRAELTLADGTTVWLNAQTKLTFPTKFSDNTREVFLDGEAYFDVAYDELQKFIVNTDLYTVNVLGTEFDVLAYSKINQFETSLIKGSVEVISRKNNLERLILRPGDNVYMRDNKLIRKDIIHYDHFLWKKGIIRFDQERIEDIFGKLCLYYDVEIRNYNESIKNMRYSGKFHTKDGVVHVMNVLKIMTGLKYEKDNEKNLIIVN